MSPLFGFVAGTVFGVWLEQKYELPPVTSALQDAKARLMAFLPDDSDEAGKGERKGKGGKASS